MTEIRILIIIGIRIQLDSDLLNPDQGYKKAQNNWKKVHVFYISSNFFSHFSIFPIFLKLWGRGIV